MNDDEVKKIVSMSATMALAARRCGMSFSTFKRRAEKLGIYSPNQGGKGTHKNNPKLLTEDILSGKYPGYSTYKLKLRLINEGYLKDECSKCGWKEKPKNAVCTPCELDHIDGNPENHLQENLQLLCPNCHSLTETYRFRRGRTNERQGRKLLDG